MTSLGETSRRAVLRGLAAIIPTATATAAIAGSNPKSDLGENPELIRLRERFAEAETVFAAAAERKRFARAQYDRLAPALPDELIRKHNERNWCVGVPETDIEGEPIYTTGAARRFVLRTRELRIHRNDLDKRPRTKAAKWIRSRIEIAQRYEAACDEAKAASGIDAACVDYLDAATTLEILHQQIAATEARTAAGLLIKARATVALSKVSQAHAVRAAYAMNGSLAQSVVAIVA